MIRTSLVSNLKEKHGVGNQQHLVPMGSVDHRIGQSVKADVSQISPYVVYLCCDFLLGRW